MIYDGTIRAAEDYRELRDLHRGERVWLVQAAADHARRWWGYWVASLAAVAPGVALLVVSTREDFRDTYGRWITSFAAVYAPAVVTFGLWFPRWLLRRSLRAVMLREDLRPSVCFRCGYDLRATPTGVCPECGERIGRKDTTLMRVG